MLPASPTSFVSPPRRRHAFTLIELLVVVSVIVLLIALLLPALRQARETARLVRCASNQRQIYVAAATYATDFDDRLPDRGNEPFSYYPAIGHAPTHRTHPFAAGSLMRSDGERPIRDFMEDYGNAPIVRWGPSDKPQLIEFRDGGTIFHCPSRSYAHSHFPKRARDYYLAGFSANQWHNRNLPAGWAYLSRMNQVNGKPLTFAVDMYNHTDSESSNVTRADGSVSRFAYDNGHLFEARFGGHIFVPDGYVTPHAGARVDKDHNNPMSWLIYDPGDGGDWTPANPKASGAELRRFGYSPSGR